MDLVVSKSHCANGVLVCWFVECSCNILSLSCSALRSVIDRGKPSLLSLSSLSIHRFPRGVIVYFVGQFHMTESIGAYVEFTSKVFKCCNIVLVKCDVGMGH